jgi:mono/diheme cytochrome c family protein
MTYPLRSDPLVVKVPTETQPVNVEAPGMLNTLPDRIRKDLGGQVVDPKDLTAKKSERAELDAALKKTFGTPRKPKVEGTVGDSGEDIADALELRGKLWAGSRLYRHHCLHCHGLTGDGHGPTAPWVNPHPRDYRQGQFKFTSTNQPAGSRKPRREDLKRTLQAGIEGTSMPSFALLSDKELDEIISYVIHLSLRGEVEYKIMKALLLDQDLGADTVTAAVEQTLSDVAANWQQAQAEEKLIKPGPYPGLTKESVQNGYKLFTDKKSAAGCVACHGDFGRKNNYMYDNWGTIVRPIDLTSGVFRGGRRPIDLYRRMHSGIGGTGMPGFSSSLVEIDKEGKQSDRKIWDLVNFLQVLPYPKMREAYGINIDE